MLRLVEKVSGLFLKKEKNDVKKKANNKGAALVSVLIAITFIAIIATSLLYMVYMNYLTKVMRHGSTDNFYTAEFALDDLSSELQDTAYLEGKSGGDISAAISEIHDKVGASGSPLRYDNAKVCSLIQVASKDASVSVNTTYPTGKANYEETSTYVKLKGVQITATDDDGYISTIVSDIIIKFKPEGSGELDICDFSVLADNPMRVRLGDTILTGCLYVQKNADDEATSGVPAGDALYVQNGGNLQILSDRGIINGDVEIKGNAVVSITGDIYVFGDIKMDAKSTLMVTGDLRVTGKLYYGGSEVTSAQLSGSTIKSIKEKDPGTSIETGWDYPGGTTCPLYNGSTKKGLVTQLFCNEVWFYNSKDTKNTLEHFDFNQYFKSSENGRYTSSSTAYDGSTELKFQMSAPDVFNNNFTNTLGLVTNNEIYTSSGAIKGTMTNSTIVTLGGAIFGEDMNGTMQSYMQRMDPDQYEWMINNCVPYLKTSDSGDYKDKDGNELGAVKMVGPDDSTCGIKMPTSKPSGCQSYTYTYGHEERTIYYNESTGVCYMPIKYLLDDDTSGKITSLFDSVSGTSDPKKSTAIYENWYKE